MQVIEGCAGWPVPSLMHRRRVLKQPITYVGLDVHKDTIAVAVAEAGKRGEAREHGKIANTAAALRVLAVKLARGGGDLRFCYEAGPCGYGIQRQLSASGHECVVVAPSLIPKRPGDRIKTDRRDASSLAELYRAGELTVVWVPDPGHEAMRDLVRARLDAVRALRRARQQLAGFLLRQSCHYRRPAWTQLHRRWLAGLRFEQTVHHIVLEDYIAAVEAAQARRMAYPGLVPSEHSSGASVRRRGLTKAGNSAARRLLIEAAWTYRFLARVSRELRLRQEEQPRPIREIAWK